MSCMIYTEQQKKGILNLVLNYAFFIYIWSRNVKLYIIINVSRFIWHAVVLGKIFQSRNLDNSSTQGLEQRVTTRHGALYSAEYLGKMLVWNAQKGGRWWITLILTISEFCLEHYQLPLSVFCFKNDQFRLRPSPDNLQMAAPYSNVSQKKYSVQCTEVRFNVAIRFVYCISC